MLLSQVALVSEIDEISASELTRVSAALQKQALRDFGPVWEVEATVDAFVRLDDVPLGYWPIVVEHDIGFSGAAGIHLDKDGQPFALVQYSDSWSLTASHECLEMLADPFGDRLVAGDSIKEDQGRVEYLVEVCDPSEAQEYAYTANGILVSDFYTPRFFDPVAASGVRYSFSGRIDAPRKILKGGYVSWHDPVSDHWWQQTWFGDEPRFRDLGVFERGRQSLREMVDAATEVAVLTEGVPETDPRLATARAAGDAAAESTTSKAEAWRARIADIKASRPTGSG
jgi:hypothetical protein